MLGVACVVHCRRLRSGARSPQPVLPRLQVPSWGLGSPTPCLGPRAPLGVGAPAAANRTDVEARILTQFEELERICPWRSYISCHGMDRMNWTVAAATRTCCHTSPGLGQWNTFRLQTYRGDRQQLFAGGDVWNVKLTEKQTGVAVTTRVFDDGDGSYTVAFVPLYPGGCGAGGRVGAHEGRCSMCVHEGVEVCLRGGEAGWVQGRGSGGAGGDTRQALLGWGGKWVVG